MRANMLENKKETNDFFSVINEYCECVRGDCCTSRCVNFIDLKLCPNSCKNKNCNNQGLGNFVSSSKLEVFEHSKLGVGVRATAEFKTNEPVFQFIGLIVTVDDYKASVSIDAAHEFGLLTNNKFVIDPTHIGNIGRFVNSSCAPNTECYVETMDGLPRAFFKALRKICKGEEITYKYKGDILKECRCCVCDDKTEESELEDSESECVADRDVVVEKLHILLPKKQHRRKKGLPALSDKTRKLSVLRNKDNMQNRQNIITPKLGAQSQRYGCPKCGLSFTRLDHMKRHVKSTHDLEQHQCEDCGARYTRADILTHHRQSKHGQQRTVPKTKRIFCAFCDNGCTSKYNLKRHLSIQHNIL